MPSESFVELWVRAFVFTQIVEVPVYLALAKTRVWKAFSLTLVTHPLLWFVYWKLVTLPRSEKTLLGELGVLAVESAMLFAYERPRLPWWKATAVAFAANAASYLAGEATRALWGFP
jgi:hypothetical protein